MTTEALALAPDWSTPTRISTAASPALSAAGLDTPIFLDHSGRRARVVRYVGRLTVALGATWVAAMLAGSLAGASLPALGSAGVARQAPPLTSAHHHGRTLVAQRPTDPEAGDARLVAPELRLGVEHN